jgi:endonuclease/exonuclease/phosphatase family metal-dependent hydrolase
LDPDLVALQEVDRRTNRLGGLDLSAELASRTGMHHVFGPAMPFDGGEYGVAILSRYPIDRVENFALPSREGSEPRTALLAFVEPSGWSAPLFFVSTHLDHQRDSTDRIAQADRLVSVLAPYAGTPGILAGDLNAETGSGPISIIRAIWNDSWTAGSGGESFPSNDPETRIDYVMVSPAARWTVLKTFTGADLKPDDQEWHELLRLASDHLPVVTILELDGGRK